MAVHSELHGFLEAIYHEALEREFNMQGIPFSKEKKLPVYYKKYKLKSYYLADFICYDSVIVEIKALRRLPVGRGSLINWIPESFWITMVVAGMTMVVAGNDSFLICGNLRSG